MILKSLVVGSFASNCYIIGSEISREAIIIDPGDASNIILKHVQELNLNIKYIVLTHGHPDHCAALKNIQEVTQAQIAIHSADINLMHDKAMSLFLGLGYHEAPEPDFLLKDSDNICISGLMLQVLSTPGHTPGSICLLGDGIVFTGDTLFNFSIGRSDLPGGNGKVLMQSIQNKLMTLPDETIVYPGHGPATTIGTERRDNPFLT
jgi:hydroxyacylglutathione hydrolase